MDPCGTSVFLMTTDYTRCGGRVGHESLCWHYYDVIMGAVASQITSLTIVYSTVYSGAYQSKHQSSASLAFVRGTHRGPVNSPHKWPVTRKMLPFDDVIMGLSETTNINIVVVFLTFWLTYRNSVFIYWLFELITVGNAYSIVVVFSSNCLINICISKPIVLVICWVQNTEIRSFSRWG